MSLRRVCERRLANVLGTVSWPSRRTHTYAWDQIRRLIPASLPRSSPRRSRTALVEVSPAIVAHDHASLRFFAVDHDERKPVRCSECKREPREVENPDADSAFQRAGHGGVLRPRTGREWRLLPGLSRR